MWELNVFIVLTTVFLLGFLLMIKLYSIARTDENEAKEKCNANFDHLKRERKVLKEVEKRLYKYETPDGKSLVSEYITVYDLKEDIPKTKDTFIVECKIGEVILETLAYHKGAGEFICLGFVGEVEILRWMSPSINNMFRNKD